MTEMQRWYTPARRMTYLRYFDTDNEVVLASDAEAAIAAAEQRGNDLAVRIGNEGFVKGYEQGQIDERDAALIAENEAFDRGYEKGQRDMLARCIAAMDGIQYRHVGTGRPKYVRKAEVLAALRVLGGSDD